MDRKQPPPRAEMPTNGIVLTEEQKQVVDLIREKNENGDLKHPIMYAFYMCVVISVQVYLWIRWDRKKFSD